MARGHGRILTSIWEDADFLALGEREQRLYLFLISQPNLNHAGLLDLTLRRWSRKARGLTSVELEKLLQALEGARFIVMDEDTEELLIRSFVRNDGVWKQPKVMGAMVSGALEISSKHLQRALLEEMNRIPLDELSSEPTKYRGEDGPSIRAQITTHIQALRKAFGDLTPDPSGRGSVTPSGTPSATPSDTPSQGDTEGGPKASTRGRAGASRAHSPAPAPTPTPAPAPEEEGGGLANQSNLLAVTDEAARPDGLAPIDADGFCLTDGMRRWAHRDGYADLVDIDHATAQFVSYYRSTGARRKSWPDAWQKWIRDDHKRASERQQSRSGNVFQLPSGQTLTGTDATVAGWAALSASFDSEEEPA
ncbi:hypothetical protein [Streptomyces sp. WAC01280]|uniref:hypothetical protein n=1 Tax=Streptomyces sp. WAC01280 TaxID=2487424 RepID=UPI000F76660D|nr:hypothetical protein [Streptomyces sp. WAC01280]RSS59846.1 hypothetical protein EF909_08280 [Streptomyces sp. WAC01280]